MASKFDHDVFICHAHEDKEDFVRPLAESLKRHGLVVWYDEFSLSLGDPLGASIDKGLARSRFGVVVLSRSFFAKRWTRVELNALLTRENALGETVILPIWHKIGRDAVASFSALLAGRFAVSSALGLDVVVTRILEKIRPHARLGAEKLVAVAVVREAGRFLLVRRRRPEKGLVWQFPATVVKAWEEPAPAVVRVVLAETGVKCTPRRKLGERVHPDTRTSLSYWLCDYVDGEAALGDADENDAVAWLTGLEALGRITSDVFAPVRALLEERAHAG